MTEAAVANATPAPGSVTSSPVNAGAAASKANQQAAAAGENQGLSNQDQAQAPAQEAPPSPEAQIPQATEERASLEPKRFKPSGNEVIDQVTNLLYNKNFEGAEAIVQEVIDTQEMSLASKAKLVDEMGADVAQLIINNLENSVKAVREAGEKEGKRLKEYAFSKFGGADPEQTWAGLQQFAQADSSLSSDDRKAMNEMLSEGGIKAEMVIDSLFNKYQQSSGYTQKPELMQGDVGTQSGFQYMSKQEYQAQIGPAINKYGESSQEVQALRNRRAISMSRGYN